MYSSPFKILITIVSRIFRRAKRLNARYRTKSFEFMIRANSHLGVGLSNADPRPARDVRRHRGVPPTKNVTSVENGSGWVRSSFEGRVWRGGSEQRALKLKCCQPQWDPLNSALTAGSTVVGHSRNTNVSEWWKRLNGSIGCEVTMFECKGSGRSNAQS